MRVVTNRVRPIDLALYFCHYLPELLIDSSGDNHVSSQLSGQEGWQDLSLLEACRERPHRCRPRQQVVAHLGDLSNFTAAEWQALAGRMGEPEMAAALERRVRQGGRQGRPSKWPIEGRS